MIERNIKQSGFRALSNEEVVLVSGGIEQCQHFEPDTISSQLSKSQIFKSFGANIYNIGDSCSLQHLFNGDIEPPSNLHNPETIGLFDRPLGSDDEGDLIVVTANLPGVTYDEYSDIIDYYGDNIFGSPPPNTQYDDGDVIDRDDEPCNNHGESSDENSTVEEQVESQAQKAHQLIKDEAGSNSKEFGYFIIEDENGNITLSDRLEGTEGEIDFGGDGLSLSETGASSWNKVLGFVHNHPYTPNSSLIPGDVNKHNRTPSDSDWEILDGINGEAGTVNFQLFIIDKDNRLRAYEDGDSRNKNISTDIIQLDGD